MTKLGKGDHVRWNTPQGKTEGIVTDKITKKSSIKGHEANASLVNPQFEVESKKTGNKALHKPESLEHI